MCSIQPTLRESNCVLPFDITQIFLQYVISPRQMSQLFFFLCSSQLECDHVNMFSRQYAVICLYFSFKLIFHRWSLVKQFFYPFSGVLEYYHASLEPIMQYPYLRTDVFQGFREIGNAILFCLQLESFLVRNITFRQRVVPHSPRDT